MSNKHYELEKLMELSFTDGFISDKEREVLRNKALKMGMNPDEVDVILDARIYELNNKDKTPALCTECGNILDETGECTKCDKEVDTDELIQEIEYELYASDRSKSELIKKFDEEIKKAFENKDYTPADAFSAWFKIIATGGIYLIYKLIKKQRVFGKKNSSYDFLEDRAKAINYRWRDNIEVKNITQKALSDTQKAVNRQKKDAIFKGAVAVTIIGLIIYSIWFSGPKNTFSTEHADIDQALIEGNIHQAWKLYNNLPADQRLEGTYAAINIKHTDSLMDAGNYELALERANLQPVIDNVSDLDREKLVTRVFKKLIPELAHKGNYKRIEGLYDFMAPDLKSSLKDEVKEIKAQKNKTNK